MAQDCDVELLLLVGNSPSIFLAQLRAVCHRSAGVVVMFRDDKEPVAARDLWAEGAVGRGDYFTLVDKPSATQNSASDVPFCMLQGAAL